MIQPWDSVEVAAASRSYEVRIGAGLIDDATAHLLPLLPRRCTAIVTDETVAALHLPRLKAALDAAGIASRDFVLPAGEANKSFASLGTVLGFLLEAGIERSDAIIAFGGGVIGDITGLAAALLRRGCPFVQIPTTLLSQVDSSVGGKTAVNMPQGKNLVGAFYQPSLVLADSLLLGTLPLRERRAGLAEIIKYGLIDAPSFFAWLEANHGAVLSGDAATVQRAVKTSVDSKARIVAQDETESACVRELLNLGHTFGHALEAATGYSDALLHGEAVAIGMRLAFDYSVLRGECPDEDATRLRALLQAAGLPVSLRSVTKADGQSLVRLMLQDKKMRAGTLPFLLARGIGKTYLAQDVSLDDVATFLDQTD